MWEEAEIQIGEEVGRGVGKGWEWSMVKARVHWGRAGMHKEECEESDPWGEREGGVRQSEGKIGLMG